jgi:hypothetical protein
MISDEITAGHGRVTAEPLPQGGGAMNATTNRQSADCKVGYGNPPVEKRFRKGQSGNPRGRPRGTGTRRLAAIVMKEAYRTVPVKQGDRIERVPTIQAVIRAGFANAIRGNGPSQRIFVDLIRFCEQELAAQAAAEAKENPKPPMSKNEIARRIAFMLNKYGPRKNEPTKDEPE